MPAWSLWATWLVGPASYGAALVYCMTYPDRCNDPPNLMLACVMVLTHIVALLMTAFLVFVPGQRRTPEFWGLVLYWAGIAGWILPVIPLMAGVDIDPRLPGYSVLAAAVAVVLMPLLGVARLVARLVRRN